MNIDLFMTMKRRRISCPLAVQQLWDAVKVIRIQKQIPDIDRITKYMVKVHNKSPEEVSRQLSYCVRDGLLILSRRNRIKGPKAGIQAEGYKIPEKKADKDSHDWYCFQCHTAGDVISCASCFRVYHISCVNNKDLPGNDVKSKFICLICKNCRSIKGASVKIKKSQLNRLLHHTTSRLREKIPLPWTERKIATAPSTYVSDRLQFQNQLKESNILFNMKCAMRDKDPWRIDHLIFKIIDLQTIENKADNGEYENVEEFRADILTFVHNIIIFHGVDSILADYGRIMLKDCNQDLEEIMRCRYCYKYSIQKDSKFWFSKPCKPPHELVYAKHDDFLYWPAKVMKIEDSSCEVRFFGGEHQLKIIDKSQILPISKNIHILQSQGRTSQWNKACEELRRHEIQLNKIIIGLATQSSSSSSSSENEEDQSKVVNCPVQKSKKRRVAKEEMEIEADNDNLKPNDEEKPVKRKRGRPPKKCNLLKKIVKKPLLVKKASSKIVEKRPRGRPKKIVDPVNIDNTNVKLLNSKDRNSKENNRVSERNEISKSTSPLKTKSSKIDEINTSVNVQAKDLDVVEHETMSSSSQALVRSVKVQTKPMEKDPSEICIQKIRAEMESEKRVAIELLIEQHKDEIAVLKENYDMLLSEVKKKHWCANCGNESSLYCCWHTAYCSIECQKAHWDNEHHGNCRRFNRSVTDSL